MKAVGEVMGIGRSFQEALHKATQSLRNKKKWIRLLMVRVLPITKLLFQNYQLHLGIEFLLFMTLFKWVFH